MLNYFSQQFMLMSRAKIHTLVIYQINLNKSMNEREVTITKCLPEPISILHVSLWHTSTDICVYVLNKIIKQSLVNIVINLFITNADRNRLKNTYLDDIFFQSCSFQMICVCPAVNPWAPLYWSKNKRSATLPEMISSAHLWEVKSPLEAFLLLSCRIEVGLLQQYPIS